MSTVELKTISYLKCAVSDSSIQEIVDQQDGFRPTFLVKAKYNTGIVGYLDGKLINHFCTHKKLTDPYTTNPFAKVSLLCNYNSKTQKIDSTFRTLVTFYSEMDDSHLVEALQPFQTRVVASMSLTAQDRIPNQSKLAETSWKNNDIPAMEFWLDVAYYEYLQGHEHAALWCSIDAITTLIKTEDVKNRFLSYMDYSGLGERRSSSYLEKVDMRKDPLGFMLKSNAMRKNEPDKAVSMYEKLIQIVPRTLGAYYELIKIYKTTQDGFRIVELCEAVLKFHVNAIIARNELAYVLMTGTGGVKRDLARARDLYEKLLSLNPAEDIQLPAYETVGLIYLYGGDGVSVDLEKAEEYLTKAKQLDPSSKEILEWLSELDTLKIEKGVKDL